MPKNKVTFNVKRFNAVMKRETKNMDRSGRANYVQIMFYKSLVYELSKKGN